MGETLETVAVERRPLDLDLKISTRAITGISVAIANDTTQC